MHSTLLYFYSPLSVPIILSFIATLLYIYSLFLLFLSTIHLLNPHSLCPFPLLLMSPPSPSHVTSLSSITVHSHITPSPSFLTSFLTSFLHFLIPLNLSLHSHIPPSSLSILPHIPLYTPSPPFFIPPFLPPQPISSLSPSQAHHTTTRTHTRRAHGRTYTRRLGEDLSLPLPVSVHQLEHSTLRTHEHERKMQDPGSDNSTGGECMY
jgi:hypothetical protein